MLRSFLTFLLLALCTAPVSAKLYRWVDEAGRVQYSDKPPSITPSSGISELNKSGMVKTTPLPVVSKEEQEKKLQEQAQQKEQQRKDRALLESFSRPEEIDIIRDRRISIIQSAMSANTMRLQTATQHKERIEKQMSRLNKKHKPIPADLDAEYGLAKKELQEIKNDNKTKLIEIETVKAKAEEDKKRLVELRSPVPK